MLVLTLKSHCEQNPTISLQKTRFTLIRLTSETVGKVPTGLRGMAPEMKTET